MIVPDLVALFRSEMSDQAEPYLWADDEIYGYADDAQKMFCRNTDGISDATTPAVVNLVVVEGDDWVDTHSSILKVRGATRVSDGRPVEVLNYEDMAPRGMRFDGRQGPVRALIVGEQDNKARVWPKSSEDITLGLLVFRLPLKDISLEEDEQPFEIAPEHHRHLLLWCKHLAYSKQDAETYDKTKAAEFEQRFYAYCERSQVEERRKRHKPRAVAYGGI